MIRVEERGGVGSVWLARAGVRNALTPGMLDGLIAAIDDLGRRSRCVLIGGEGRVFCAGFDLALCRGAPDGGVMGELLSGLDGAVRAMRRCPAPVVVACQGAAIAGGCALVAGGDFAVADRGARLGYPVVVLGVSPAVSGPTLSPRIGGGAARVRMLDPGLISGEEAVRIGLVSDLVGDREEVAPAAWRLAEHLGAKPPLALAATKRWLGEVECGPPAAGWSAGDGLAVSLSLVGGEEEGRLLSRIWAGKGP